MDVSDKEHIIIDNENFTENKWNMNLFEQLTSLEGRINRMRYFLLNILSMVIMFLLFIPNIIISIFLPEILWPLLDLIFFAPVVYIGYAITIKRLYDTGRSDGWIIYTQMYYVLLAIYIISPIGSTIELFFDVATAIMILPLGIVCLFFKGDEGENEYGPDPLA